MVSGCVIGEKKLNESLQKENVKKTWKLECKIHGRGFMFEEHQST